MHAYVAPAPLVRRDGRRTTSPRCGRSRRVCTTNAVQMPQVEATLGAHDAITVSLIALGCPKNTVDAEVMLGDLEGHGLRIAADAAEADVLIVNTCSFIEDAKRESVQAILTAAKLKRRRAKAVVVTGCLAQRYADELAKELPEVDAVVGFAGYGELGPLVQRLGSQPSPKKRGKRASSASSVEVGSATVPFRPEWGRHRLTPRHSAYLRVAEGCDHKCAFCAIPSFRGKFRSKPWASVVAEARRLVAHGAVELNLIAEDTNQYGVDFEGGDPRRLSDLLRELSKLEGLRWIRLLYCYPSYFSEELVDAIAELDKVVKYIDIPLQHISDEVLRRMRRPGRKHTETLLQRLRSRIPGLQLRSTFITGFPGETAAHHAELVRFVRDFGFHRGGFFAYSREEGTAAAELDANVDDEVSEARRDELVSLQQDMQMRWARERVGTVMDVLIERHENGHAVGRTAFDAPEIDSLVHVLQPAEVGTIVRAKIIGADALDLVADADADAVAEADLASARSAVPSVASASKPLSAPVFDGSSTRA